MRVTEIFHSVQGEGVNIGVPSIFVRLTGCNIHCTKETVGFDCDTSYAWNEGKEMSVEDVVNEIKKYNCKHIIWTGGEPTLQNKEMLQVIDKLGKEYSHELETNGTIYINPIKASFFEIITISPKKGTKPLLDLYKDYKNAFFKFVIVDKEEIGQIMDEIVYEYKLPLERVMFMPEGITDEEIKEKSLWLVEECKRYGVRFCPRLQIWLYGNVRGK
jgi:organic radical activating enzyme